MAISFIPDNEERDVLIPTAGPTLEGTLSLPAGAQGLVLFAHGSGSGRQSPRNRAVARVLHNAGLSTLLFDLLTRGEEAEDMGSGHLRFNIGMLAARLGEATRWAREQAELKDLPIGYFGASTGAAAALVAASEHPDWVSAVVSRGGRPDMAYDALERVQAPTLLIVGGDDEPVLSMNRDAMRHLRSRVELVIVPGATHLFEEPGALDEVARHATNWFLHHLTTRKAVRDVP